MEKWRAALSTKLFEDYTIRVGPVPTYDPENHVVCRSKCEENLCGCYGTNWACPPGFSMDIADLYGRTDYVLVVHRTFCLDVQDQEVVEATCHEMQKIVRIMSRELRSNGLDCMGFADGGCKYCGVCAYPEPCRFPDMMTPSVSSLGLDLKDYLGSMGEPFYFSDTCMTLYGLIFILKG
ncbi:MAG: hypothetical protein IJ026_03840 [Candidatus Methanomethylophilaceae archaeon]|nr:hypothetical protein [Candidatus Methanomethylophilaceae archaeon]